MEKTMEKLGTTTNLLYGYDATWLSESKGNEALFPVPGNSLKKVDIQLPETIGAWSLPFVSLHDTAESLLDALFPYEVKNPSDGTKPAQLSSGVLLIGDSNREAAIKNLSSMLGVDLSKKETGYALVQLKRTDGEASHNSRQMGVLIHPNPSRIPQEFGVTEEYEKAMAALKRIKLRGTAFSPDMIGKEDANDYLNFFAKQGTHFISKITFGDVIFQVYAMPRERYERVKKIYAGKQNMLSGSEAILFRQYTTDSNDGKYGYVREYGKILSFSQSSVLSAAVAKKDWIENIFAQRDSIFAVFQEEAKVTLDTLNTAYTDVTSIKTNLTPLTLFAEHSRKQIWNRIFKGAIIQKYKAAIQPDFVPYCNCDIADKLQQNELPGFLSNIATPVINTYKTSLDLSDLSFVAAEEVKTFSLYSNLLRNSQQKTIAIPGKDILISAQLISLEKEGHITTIEINDDAIKSLSISAQHFFGALLVKNTSGTDHFSLIDGLKYISNDKGINGGSYVAVVADIRKPPEVKYLERLKASLQFNFAFSEASINSLTNSSCANYKSFIQQSLLWVTQIIPANTLDDDLLNLRVQALDLAHIESDLTLGSFVPILPYKEYDKQVRMILDYTNEIDKTIDRFHSDIETRKTRELIIDVAKSLNENIINSGELLSGYVKASVAQQQSLSGYYDSIIKQKQDEQKKQESTIGALQAEMNSQKAEVVTAVENYKQSIKDWEITEAIKFGLTIATDLFSLGTSILIPAKAINSVKELGLMAQRIQKFLNIINATYKLYSDSTTGIDKIKDAQKTFDGLSDTLTANLSWDEMSITMDEVLSTGPSDSNVNRKKAALVAAFKIYILKGKALTSAKSSAHQLARDIYNQQCQKNLSEEQAKRLSELNTNLSPAHVKDLDKSKIDLMGLTGSLSLVRSQMLGILSKAFILQDQSLQYTYLQPATPIASFDILGIKGALVVQSGNTVAAKTSLYQCQPSITTPIDIEVEVPAEDLKNGAVYQFNLQPNVAEFFKYVDVRVQSVVARIEGLKSTDSGDYLLNLAYSGRPFYDRSVNRDTIVFNTLRRERTYEYKLEGNQPKFSDKGDSWSENVNAVTPFSIWEISLPQSKTNKGLCFEGLTAKIILTFVLNTRIHDAREKLMMLMHNRVFGSTPIKPAVNTLLAQMADKSVLNNWDVVFNMSLDKINHVLVSQYESLKENDKNYGGKVVANTAIQGANIGDINTYTLQKFNINYGYPKLQFLINDGNTGDLEMQITSGTVEKGSRYVGNNNDSDRMLLESIAKSAHLPVTEVKEINIDGKIKLVLEYYNQAIPLGTTAALKAIIKMGQVQGLVNDNKNILSVVLDMQKGAFAAKDIEIEMSDEQKIAFSDAVKAYFQEHPVTFIINSLDLSGIATLADLKPHQFLFKALKTQTGNQMLQLFIQTNNRAAFNYSQTFISSSVPDPIPENSECSLMINSRIFFGSVLPGSLTGGWQLEGSNPGDTSKTWSALMKKGSVQGNVDLSSLDHSYTPPRGSMTTHYSYSPADGNPVSWSIEGMMIKPSGNGKMTMDYSKKNTFYFNEKSKTCGIFGCNSPRTRRQSTDITLNIYTSLPTEITGSGRDQGVKINLSDKDVSISARTSGGGPCGSDDLQSKVNNQLKQTLPQQIKDKINVGFNGVSVFALKNLLFPSNNYIDLQSVYVPGDLLILGDFIESKS